MIRAWVTGAADMDARLDRIRSEVEVAVRLSMGRACLMLQRHIQQNKLSGQALNARSGQLRASIIARPVTEVNGLLVGEVGSTLSYARMQEEGFHGRIAVRARLKQGRKFGKLGKQPRPAGNRVVHLKPHAFLHGALREMGEPARKLLLEGLKRGIHA
ncbi:HK97 gp10 family phage protein [Leeia sp.]|uniref:HK97 gp10 family phage protein n=1 Tax=Leeia sp. TaxID=2884678 RepID=UPI0035B3E5FC